MCKSSAVITDVKSSHASSLVAYGRLMVLSLNALEIVGRPLYGTLIWDLYMGPMYGPLYGTLICTCNYALCNCIKLQLTGTT